MATTGSVAVIGAGSWGTALAILIARNGYPVSLWGRDAAQMTAMARERRNRRYLPEIELPDGLTPTDDLSGAVAAAEGVLLAVPSHGFRDTLKSVQPMVDDSVPVFWATKGLEPGSRKFLHTVAQEELGDGHPIGVVSGPTFAREVALGLPTAVTVAAADGAAAAAFAEILHGDAFRAYTCTDLVGVEVGGAAKNVLALAAGIADGLGFGANTRAALITRGLAEMMRLGARLGGQPETLMGLAGLGDLVLTCTDDQSRNRRVGMALGRGVPLDEAIAEVGQAVEGVKGAPEVCRLAHDHGVEMPIVEQVHRVIDEGLAPQAAVEALLAREPKSETEGLGVN